MNVTIYCRISLDRTGESLGVERQETECRAYCERQGWAVREVIVDNDISATSGKVRPGFERLLTSEPEAVVVWHTDRLVRLSRELERVIDLRVDVYALHAGHLDLSNPAGRAVAKTVTAWAQYEGEQKGLRQRASHTQRAAQGRPWWTKRPFGYELDGTLRVHEAAALSAAYTEFVARRMTLSEIARQWNEAGLTTTGGKPWTQANLRQVLANPRNAAIRMQHGREVGPGQWSPVVDGETFRAAQVIFRDPARNHGGGGRRKGLLVGVALCGKCGSTMRLSTNGRQVKADEPTYRRVYSCSQNQCTSHPIAEVDAYVGTIMQETLRDPRFVTTVTGDGGATERLMAEREALTVSMKGLGEDYADGLLSRDEFRSLRRRQQQRLDSLEASIMRAMERSSLSGLPSLDVMADGWDDESKVSLTEKRRAISAFLTVVLMPRVRGERSYDPAASIRVSRVDVLAQELADKR